VRAASAGAALADGPLVRPAARSEHGRRRHLWHHRAPANPVGGLLGLAWLAIVLVPIYWVVITSLRTQAGFFSQPPLALPAHPSLENYRAVLTGSFFLYLRNSVVVTTATVLVALVVSFTAAFAIVRGTHWALRLSFSTFLLGLAIPVQATIIPLYLVVSGLGLYDTLTALVLPGVAFSIPLTVVILVNFLRDVPSELFDAMRIDGAGEWRLLWSLALPLGRPAVVTVAVYDALNAWNAFLFPLILTQSDSTRVLPLGVWQFQGQFMVNVPAVLAFVVLSSLPIVALYALGRRQLVGGLLAGFGR
jgi:raffinose/stachyose/melibiose transport system permease protein